MDTRIKGIYMGLCQPCTVHIYYYNSTTEGAADYEAAGKPTSHHLNKVVLVPHCQLSHTLMMSSQSESNSFVSAFI